VTPNNFSKDGTIQACYTLMEVIKENIKAFTIGCTKWVINLEESKESACLDTSMFGNVSITPRCSKPRKFEYYGSGLNIKS
jgi:hypothetical protein